MSKYEIGVGETFPLDEGQPRNDCRGHHGRHHHHHDDDHHHRHHHAHMAALAMLFALKAYRRHMRPEQD